MSTLHCPVSFPWVWKGWGVHRKWDWWAMKTSVWICTHNSSKVATYHSTEWPYVSGSVPWLMEISVVPACTNPSSCKILIASKTHRDTYFNSRRLRVFVADPSRRSPCKRSRIIVIGTDGSLISSIKGRRYGVRCWNLLSTSRSFSTRE